MDRAEQGVWTIPVAVANIPESGLRIPIQADDETRAAIARQVGLRDLARLEGFLTLTPIADGAVRVEGSISAQVGQTCVVTLERVENLVEETVDLTFAPPGSKSMAAAESVDPADGEYEPPEPLLNGTIDLGGLAVEFLALGLDPYPRKAGAVFEPLVAPDDPADHPFAGLAALKPAQDT